MAHAQAGSFVLSFSLSLMGQEPGQESGEFSGQGFSRIRMSSPSMPFEGVVSSDGSAAPGHLCLQLVLASPTWFCCCSGPGAELQLRPRHYLQGRKVTLGLMSLFSQFYPLPGTWDFPPRDHLHLAVNCLAIVFTCLSFPIPLTKEFPQLLTILSPYHCPLSSLYLPSLWLWLLDSGTLNLSSWQRHPLKI